MAQKLRLTIKGQLHSEEIINANYIFPKDGVDVFSYIDSDPGRTTQDLGLKGADTELYSIAETTTGIVYAYRRILPNRGDCAMVAIHVNGPTNDGRRLRERLADILNYALKEKSSSAISDDIIQEKLSGCLDLFDWGEGPNPSLQNEKASIKNDAYRVYESEEKLNEYLENPYQTSYSDFKAIHLVSVASNPVPSNGCNIKKIDTPIETTLFFEFPSGVKEKDGKLHVGEKESFSLIYEREKYENFPVNNLRSSNTSNNRKYFKVDGKKIIVKNSDEANIKFSRYITFIVSDEKNNPINEFVIEIRKIGEDKWIRYEIQDRQDKRLNGSNDQSKVLLEDGQYEYLIKSDGYNQKKDSVDTKNINGSCDVVLEPQSDEQELYLIPAFMGKKAASSGQKEKVSINYTKNNIFYKKYAEFFGQRKSAPIFYVMRKRPKPRIIAVCILSLLVGLTLGLVGGKLIRNNQINWKDEPVQEVVEVANEQPENTDNIQRTTTSALESTETPEEHDVTYLNSNNIWMLDNLQSYKYKYFLQIVVANRGIKYKDVNWNDFNAITNPKWAEILQIIKEACESSGNWEAFNSIEYSKMKTEIEETKMIDLEKAVQSIPKSQPQQSANTNQRSKSTKNK